MELKQFLEYLASGKRVEPGSEELILIHAFSQEAMRTTCALNNKYHTLEEVIELF